MTTNRYFADYYSLGTPEQELMDSLIRESIQINGRDMFYVPRERVAFDELFGEDKLSAFREYFKLEFYVESVSGFGGPGDLLSKLGLEIRDEIELIVSRSRFKEEVVSRRADIFRPREGDLVFLPMPGEGLFEIMFAEDKSVFFQFGNLFVWKLKLKRFEMAGESFETGVDVIDAYEASEVLTTELTLTTGTGEFSPGEIVRQGTSSGTVTFWNEDMDKLTLYKVKGEFKANLPIIGDVSGASWIFDEIKDVEAKIDKDNNIQNTLLKDFDSTVIDTTEKDPYSEGI